MRKPKKAVEPPATVGEARREADAAAVDLEMAAAARRRELDAAFAPMQPSWLPRGVQVLDQEPPEAVRRELEAIDRRHAALDQKAAFLEQQAADLEYRRAWERWKGFATGLVVASLIWMALVEVPKVVG